MTPAGQTIGLCMIVKDEAPVIRRCLASVRPLVDHWIVVDTGSRDGTQDIVRAVMAGLPGALVERPWVDFAHNRSEALALARPHADYSLIIDADDELVLAPGFAMPRLEADSYIVDIEDTSLAYQRTQLVANRLPWRYVGVLHEFLSCPEAGAPGLLPVVMRRNHDGRRRRDPNTYRNDAAILVRALESESDPFLVARYTLYLAQSWRDCGERERALGAYLRRAALQYWDQEVFVSLLNAGRLMEALGHPADLVLAVYRAADAACTGRSEAAHAASRLCRQHDRFAEGYAFAAAALDRPAPDGGLFVEPWIYDYGLADELAVHAYWTGRYRECLTACDKLLREGKIPNDMRARVEANRRFALDKLGIDASPAPTTVAPRDHAAEPIATAAAWRPSQPQGGTEIMTAALRGRLGGKLERIDLRVNRYEGAALDGRPLVLWMHHDIDQPAVQWLDDGQKAARVACFVFVSSWQRERYLARFGLPADRCLVLRNATEVSPGERPWPARKPWKMAYASTPYRGLSVLLEAWDRLRPADAELHIWSSHRLYGPEFDDAAYAPLFERARAMPGVTHHGIVPNAELRAALRDCDFLTYPCTFAETSCLTAIEAMAAGCRVICPDNGALPETVGAFGRIYPFVADVEAHAVRFAEALADEMADPWGGDPSLRLEQASFVRAHYDWSVRAAEWEALVDRLAGAPAPVAARPPVVLDGNRVALALLRLRDRGLAPGGILDVGAYQGEFARVARQIFADAHIRMIDALPENAAGLAQVCHEIGNAQSTIAVLGADEGAATPFFVVDTEVRPDLVKTGSSKFRENADFPMQERSVAQRRLDVLVEGDGRHYGLIKLDVQGAELDVLRGLGSRIADVEVLLIEMSLVEYNKGAPLIADVLGALADLGFVLTEIVEEHRYRDGGLLQLDGIFTRAASRFRPQPPFWS